MGGRVLFLARFEFAELMQPGECSLDHPTGFAQAAAVRGAPLGEDWSYPLFLIAWRCGSES
jgi:hypothetical protein